jgi:AraC-like DNA-binding protein
MQILNQPTVQSQMSVRVALHPFLAGMNATHLALLSDCAIAVHFKKGQTILREGELANRFYLIESGKVVLESGEKSGDSLIIETIGPGNLLGWSWMFPPYVWNFTARAAEPTDAVFFYGTLSLKKVAKAVNMNANHLSENFKHVTGINFVEYVARTHFVTACDLLRHGNRRISEIAFAAGFQSLSQFNRVFKKFSGKSPTQYRRSTSLSLGRR